MCDKQKQEDDTYENGYLKCRGWKPSYEGEEPPF